MNRVLSGCNCRAWAVAAILAIFPCATTADVIYVNASSTNTPTGQSWQDAFLHLQDALAVATEGDEIWVAQGTYMPDGGRVTVAGEFIQGDGDREASFYLVSGVATYGGFAGDETYLYERDIEDHPTILSGDLRHDDEPGMDMYRRYENSCHVVQCVSLSEGTLLDGFTVTGGGAGIEGCGFWHLGGGIYISQCSPLIRHCTIRENYASWGGGGIFNNGPNTVLEKCTFIRNRVPLDMNIKPGGAIYTSSTSSPSGETILKCLNCRFIANISYMGSAIYVYNSESNWLFSVRCEATNCSFSCNSGTVIFASGDSAWCTLNNCVVWSPWDHSAAGIMVNYSCWGGSWHPNGVGSIFTDPLFVRMPDPGPDGTFDGIDDDYGDLRLQPGSPCIDAGDNDAVPAGVTTDFDGGVRFIDDGSSRDTGNPGARGVPIVDMGAFEAIGDCNLNGIMDEIEPDFDEDGAIDDCEVCIEDPLKTDPDICGCGVVDIDTDLDGVMDCHDLCAETPPDSYVDLSGCVTGFYDLDRDGDVDQTDFGIMQACYWDYHLPNPLGPECERPLGDGERGFGLVDVQNFVLCQSGANVPSDPACVD